MNLCVHRVIPKVLTGQFALLFYLIVYVQFLGLAQALPGFRADRRVACACQATLREVWWRVVWCRAGTTTRSAASYRSARHRPDSLEVSPESCSQAAAGAGPAHRLQAEPVPLTGCRRSRSRSQPVAGAGPSPRLQAEPAPLPDCRRSRSRVGARAGACRDW